MKLAHEEQLDQRLAALEARVAELETENCRLRAAFVLEVVVWSKRLCGLR